jgi:hypothetical protein
MAPNMASPAEPTQRRTMAHQCHTPISANAATDTSSHGQRSGSSGPEKRSRA